MKSEKRSLDILEILSQMGLDPEKFKECFIPENARPSQN